MLRLMRTNRIGFISSNYDESGKTDSNDNAKRFNIARNNLYRFTITVRDSRLMVNVQEWKYAYDNEYTFD